MKVETKLSIFLALVAIVPAGAALMLANQGHIQRLELFLCVFVILFTLALKPLAHYLANVIFMADIRAMNRFCLHVKQGEYGAEWPLPPERDDEHELMQLKRNFYWMVHAISSREDWLRRRLSDTAQSMEEFERLSSVDGLTRIYNRRFFEGQIKALAARASENGEVFYLLMIDCDGFKNVNDNFGHQAGDDLLVRLADILRLSTREEKDTAFRYGGDEFGVLVRGVTRSGVLALAERIRRRFEDLKVEGTSLSIGVAEARPTPENQNPESLAQTLKIQADTALYQAKNNGKNRVAIAWQAAAVPRGRKANASGGWGAAPDPAQGDNPLKNP